MNERGQRLQVPPVEPRLELMAVVRRRARARVRILGTLFGVGLSILSARGAQLCLTPDGEVVERGARQRWGQVVVQAPRGEVRDRRGNRLSTSVLTPTIAVDPSLVPVGIVPEMSQALSEILELDAGNTQEVLKRSGQYAIIAPRVHPAQAVHVQALRSTGGSDYRGLIVQRNFRRYYPEGALASQLLGFIDGQGRGVEGLESTMNDYLAGTDLVEQRLRDRRGLEVERPSVRQAAGHQGMTVHTTIDRRIQRIAERALAGIVERHEPLTATAVVVDVRTGDLWAMAQAPTFNPNAMGQDDVAYRRNRSVRDAWEPGSVIKPFTVAAALETGAFDFDAVLETGATMRVGGRVIHDDHPHDQVTISELIKYSSNIGAAKLAFGVGAEPLLRIFGDFGFGSVTGIQLPGERAGSVFPAKSIRPIELATTSYGQGITTTTLQLAMATATLANNGVRMKPRLVTRVEDAYGVPALVHDPEPWGRVVSEGVAQQVIDTMVTVTEPGGTGTSARIPGYRVGGKTGTAWKVKDGQYGNARVSSFIGVAPADDPVFAIAIVVDEPSIGSRYGSVVAAPAFAEIASGALDYLGVSRQQDLWDPVADEEVRWEIPPQVTPIEVSWTGEAWRMPDLAGRAMRDVLGGLQHLGLRIEVEGTGFLAMQTPGPGAALVSGDTVQLAFQ